MNAKMALGLFTAVFLCASILEADELSLEEKVKEMKRNLELTDVQVKEIRPIMQEYKNTVDSAKQRKENKLKTVLSPQQMDMLEKLDEEDLQGGLPK